MSYRVRKLIQSAQSPFNNEPKTVLKHFQVCLGIIEALLHHIRPKILAQPQYSLFGGQNLGVGRSFKMVVLLRNYW